MNLLPVTILLLAASVVAVALFRRFQLPPVLGYLVVGTLVGPHAFGLLRDVASVQHLAEFGVVFLMFSIGLEFSLPKLHAMRQVVFGLGSAQVLGVMAAVLLICLAAGLTWQAGIALGGIVAMSSTAVLSKLLAERLELDSPHGRQVIGVLLFQDLAVVPLLILIPAFAEPAGEMLRTLGLAALKAVFVLTLVLYLGQKLMRRLFYVVARRQSAELFVLNVLLVTLGLSYVTELAGLSLALGAFVAGMLISETEFRHQVDEDIKPFRDVLMGLFFVTVGMLLDPHTVLDYFPWVLLALVLLLLGKFALVAGLSRLMGASPGTALRSGLWLAAGGEFGFVLISLTGNQPLMPMEVLQVVLAALVLSMLAAPLIVHYSERIVMRLATSEWMLRSMQLTRIAAQTMATDRHVLICGFGRSGQHLARFLAREGFSYVALDLDPEHVREAVTAGESAVYGDATRKETLVAAGLSRAQVLVVTFNDTPSAERILHHVQQLRPDLPVVVRTADERDLERLAKAGAAEVVPDVMEATLMLASHALVLLGVPLNRVLRRLRETRSERYRLLRGFFHGLTERADDSPDIQAPRLHSVLLTEQAHGVGRSIEELGLDQMRIEVSAVRRRGITGVEPAPDMRFQAGDVVVLLGGQYEVSAAETRLLKG
ncbi:monovalent cation:proton antiporter family protein [Oryzomicrobium sp.]|uniref:monovalent cation:proton antiporter family protein n=1 Tax=Oryzomicrobium sp. TaxID=1911578 RepID=UPI0025D0D4A5|nr:monovalent cation:proton antiporter family protein [Oryzomicrobium sp.]MCE1241653.1 monovalent cation:proton antiporter-2 (CPA2) family protein [Oryzomicrobium sp.]